LRCVNGGFSEVTNQILYSNAVLIGSFLHSVEGTREENDTRGGTLWYNKI
jgi:hypothetical protein